jgi:hypothetical protein
MKRIVFVATVLALLGIVYVAGATIKDTNLYNINTLNGIIPGDSVRVTNIVITGIDTNPTTYGFWAQEQASPECGMLIYMGSLYPTYLKRGEIMRVTGKYTEYPGPDTSNSASEINCYYSWQLDSLGMGAIPDPLLMSTKDLGYWPADAPRAEPWEGLLIRVDTVIVVNGAENYPRSYVIREAHRGAGNHGGAGLGDTVYVRNDKMDINAPTRLADLDTLASLTGAWYFEYGEYRLCPRDADDIVPLHPVPPHVLRAYAASDTSIKVVFDIRLDTPTAQTKGNYSLGTSTLITNASLDPVGEQIVTLRTATQTPGTPEAVTAVNVRSKTGTPMNAPESYAFRAGLCPMSLVQAPKSALNDSSAYFGEEVTVAGIVTGDKTIFTTEFYVENTPGGPWSGLKIYGGIPTPVANGDSVIVAGFVTEYYNDTEITPVHYLRIVSSGKPIPGPDSLGAGKLNGQSSPSAERWEGVFVRMNPAFVYDTLGWGGFGEWAIWDLKSPADSTKIGHSGKYTYVPRIGKWMSLQGPVSYSYGNYRIEPRLNSDIDTVNVVAVGPGTLPKPAVFALEQNAPNPFNPVTNIFFSIPEKGEVELYVYDISGRVVKRLVDGVPMEPGRHKATWDGRNDAGRAVSSGVYFCKLVAADKVAKMKMVILK